MPVGTTVTETDGTATAEHDDAVEPTAEKGGVNPEKTKPGGGLESTLPETSDKGERRGSLASHALIEEVPTVTGWGWRKRGCYTRFDMLKNRG